MSDCILELAVAVVLIINLTEHYLSVGPSRRAGINFSSVEGVKRCGSKSKVRAASSHFSFCSQSSSLRVTINLFTLSLAPSPRVSKLFISTPTPYLHLLVDFILIKKIYNRKWES